MMPGDTYTRVIMYRTPMARFDRRRKFLNTKNAIFSRKE